MERALGGELTHHSGYEKGDQAGRASLASPAVPWTAATTGLAEASSSASTSISVGIRNGLPNFHDHRPSQPYALT